MPLNGLVSSFKNLVGFSLLERQIELYDTKAFEGFSGEDEDCLLFQWGTFNWGEGEFFELDITRQLSSSPDEDIIQLNVTLRFSPTEELRALNEGNFWCYRKDDLPMFWNKVREHPAYQQCKKLSVAESALDVECV